MKDVVDTPEARTYRFVEWSFQIVMYESDACFLSRPDGKMGEAIQITRGVEAIQQNQLPIGSLEEVVHDVVPYKARSASYEDSLHRAQFIMRPF